MGAYANHADADLESVFRSRPGTHAVGVAFVRKAWEPEDVLQPPRPAGRFGTDEMYDAQPRASRASRSRAVRSRPARATRRAAGAFSSAARSAQRWRARSEGACARTILSPLAAAPTAGRSTDDDVEHADGLLSTRGPHATAASTPGSSGARADPGQPRLPVPHRAAIPPASAPGAAYRVSDVELASRLSFFLWSSIPDDELLDLGGNAATLRNRGVLEQQVRRMLADPRATALVENFAGQWLQLRDLAERRRRIRICSRSSTRTCATRSGRRPSCSSTASCATIAASPSC